MITFSRILCLSIALALAVTAKAQEATDTAPERPKSYTVQPGDTLWKIAETFYFEPWKWRDIWHANSGIDNPNLIYPGDVIYLAEIDGKVALKAMRGSRVKLVPHIRSTPIAEAIPAIPIDAIHQFLTRPSVIEEDQEEVDQRPYVLAFAGDRLIAGAKSTIYVRGPLIPGISNYNVVRPGELYRDSKSGELLGREALWVGEAELRKIGDPSTFYVKESEREVATGDRLYPVAGEHSIHAFYPHPPEQPVDAGIISVLDGVTQIGQYDVVVIDRGEEAGLQVGDVLQIDHQGGLVRDKFSGVAWDEVELPSVKAASLMVFRTFPKISYALVMQASRPLHVGDRARNPDAKGR
jgi:hypothetical protein